jgi:uncharacterized MAPEG superfamily protein
MNRETIYGLLGLIFYITSIVLFITGNYKGSLTSLAIAYITMRVDR